MKRSFQTHVLLAILTAGIMFSSCGNVDIIKRKYRPGFHVDISKKRDKTEVAEASTKAEKRIVAEESVVETVKVEEILVKEESVFTAQTSVAEPLTLEQEKRVKMKEVLRSPEFEQLTFDQKMKTIRNEVFKPSVAPVGGSDWMKWVSFGTGIGSLAFGALALIFAILTVVFFSSFVWGAAVLALLLGAAAITFSIIYKKNNGTGPQARLGFIFGIIGAGLAVLAIILGAIFFAIFVL